MAGDTFSNTFSLEGCMIKITRMIQQVNKVNTLFCEEKDCISGPSAQWVNPNINGLIIMKTLIRKIPPNLPFKGVPRFAGFDKEGQGEIF
jgi:hypothetical protein